jgi:pimeloyl-ACP methyl ester carboxylesterase
MSNHESIRKLWFVMPLFTAFAFLFIIPSTAVSISNNSHFGTTNLAYGQSDQMNSNVTKSLNIQNIPVKKVHVGDIDITYKMFGKGKPLLLIAGVGATMDAWDPIVLKQLSANHTVIIFDNRGIGQTSAGTIKSFSISQYANDTPGLIGALQIGSPVDVLGHSLGSLIAQELTLMHPDKVNKLILCASNCGGKDAIPGNPEVNVDFAKLANPNLKPTDQAPIIADLLFPQDWKKDHPNYL